ncbi:MAG TPA: HEAT repeat domain-containing protein, partial [Pirellulaceae bacterium]|nr:HEAT repeat domain-containing protein [Pirellulaceae bacterium]
MADAAIAHPEESNPTSSRWLVLVILITVLVMVLFVSGWIPWPWGNSKLALLQDLIADARSPDNDQRIPALLQLGQHREFLPDSLPAILESLNHREELVRNAARLAIKDLGDEVVPLLKPWLESEDIQQYAMGAEAVRALGPTADVWTDHLIARLDHEDMRFRLASLFALREVGPSAIRSLDACIRLLDDPEFNIVINACRVLAGLGPAANKATPKIMTLLPDDDKNILSVRSTAAETLGALGPVEGIDVVGAISAKLDAFYHLEKERALIGLGYLGKAAAPALPKIKSLMGDSADPTNQTSRSVMPRAALTYYLVSGDLERTLSVLEALLESPSYENETILRIAELRDKAKPLVPGLIKKLDASEEFTREQAVWALAEIGAAAAEAIGKLKQLADRDP